MGQNENITVLVLGWKLAFKEMSSLKRAFSCSSLRSLRPRSVGLPRLLCSDVGRTWEEKELDQKLVKKYQFKVQVGVRPELAFPWKLLLASSYLRVGVHSLWGPGQHGDVRFHVQTSLNILRHWSHSVKPRAGLTWSHWCRSHSHEAVSALYSPLFQTHTWDISEVEHGARAGEREERCFPSLSYL